MTFTVYFEGNSIKRNVSNLFEESDKIDDRTKTKNGEVKWEVIFKGMHA